MHFDIVGNAPEGFGFELETVRDGRQGFIVIVRRLLLW